VCVQASVCTNTGMHALCFLIDILLFYLPIFLWVRIRLLGRKVDRIA